MASNSFFSSVANEQRWVLQVDKNFPQEEILEIDINAPTSVFLVPKSLSETKPETYAPQHLGIGPYHHLRPELYLMQKQKLAAVRNFLNQRNQLQTFQRVVEFLVQSEPLLRACYDQYLDLNIQALARIFAIDGLYLLQFLENCSAKSCDDPEFEKLIGDVLMLENQIPKILLQKIAEVLQLNCSGECDSYLFKQFQDVCFAQSPLKLRKVILDKNHLHLLHQMYYLIVNNMSPDMSPRMSKRKKKASAALPCDANDVGGFLENQGVLGAAQAAKILSFMEKVPWGEILGFFKKGGGDEENLNVEEIDIPSVSEMTEIAGITFKLTPGGIRDIQFIVKEKRFYLPVISLKTTSEIILRNLVAFEAVTVKPGSPREFAEYVDLMCGIVDSNKDVDILRKAKIIESEMSDEEIVRIFNGINKSTGKNVKRKSNIEQAIDAGNQQYDNVFSVKVKRFIESYWPALAKSLKAFIYVAILLLLTLQAYCSVFGCSRWFGKSSSSSTVYGGDNHLLYSDQ